MSADGSSRRDAKVYDRLAPKPALHGEWRDDARREWHAAEEVGTLLALAAWAQRWGSALVGDHDSATPPGGYRALKGRRP